MMKKLFLMFAVFFAACSLTIDAKPNVPASMTKLSSIDYNIVEKGSQCATGESSITIVIRIDNECVRFNALAKQTYENTTYIFGHSSKIKALKLDDSSMSLIIGNNRVLNLYNIKIGSKLTDEINTLPDLIL